MKNLLTYILLIVLAQSIIGCGATKSSNLPATDLSSRGNPTDGDTGSTPGTVPITGILTECSGFDKDGLAGNLTTYYDPVTGQYVETYIRMTITNALEAMATDPEKYVQIYRWSVDSSGVRAVSSVPTKIYFIQRGTGQAININDPATHLSGSVISGLISKYSLVGITATNFYDNFIIVLGDIGLTYDAITVATYDSSNTATETMDLLLPAFSADPNEYAQTHISSLLQSLHPNWGEKDGGFTALQYKSMSDQACIPQ